MIFGAAVWPGGVPSDTMRRRVAAARQFGAALDRPLYVPTGAVGRNPPAEAEVMARLLRTEAVPAEDILPEPTGTDTLSSARAVAALLAGHAGPVFACSSGYHLPRCVLLLRLCGLPARAAPAPEESPVDTWRYALREIPALPYDALLAWWSRRRSHGTIRSD